ncbi:hypothetical protein OSB04_003439 [Centaurea solstitialis]|uniref:Reverse transcriptase Ty1/copia-type domain-containing protein n=1 Tax=Centaurea solstitialis TaxID=347529 RepID=A0AA38UCJ0_9ASTR|nr:hypothetical protein OSB04_003439 [Centaurea solstitialis]
MKDPSWIEAMQEELLQFVLQHVWDLVDLPRGHRVIGTKWIFRNKTDERGIVMRSTYHGIVNPQVDDLNRPKDTLTCSDYGLSLGLGPPSSNT